MKSVTFSMLGAVCAGVLVLGGSAFAADYPSKQLELVVPYAAGGGTDLLARAYADTAKNYAGQAIGVVNKTGGAGAIGLSDIARGKADGYKIGMGTVEMSMLPHMGQNAAFTIKDFTPIARLNAEPSAISVNKDSPLKTVEEFLEFAKANPGKIRIGNSGPGAIWHIAAAALEDKAGITVTHVPFDGAAPAITALLGGHIEAVTVSVQEVASHVDGGNIRLLAVLDNQRHPKYPDIPTLKEKGVDVAVSTWRGIVGPANLPADVVAKLSDISAKTAADPAFQETLKKMNLTAAYLDAAGFKDAIEKDNAFFEEFMAKLGIGKK
ncbi:MAG: tripartite tricarboxylate transporter substrate binding protein [Methylobacteriaceae bacterium]|jgi:tripartite-type tricarboxylate transporter receptor subunit TctC|nr:tripartite tricarboxylate transporter substrate binding protein [Methylobacteriaceae bacterium]